MAEVIRPVGSGCTTAFSHLNTYLQVSAKAGPSNVISFSWIILIFLFFENSHLLFFWPVATAHIFSPVRHKLQPIGHFRVWDVLHLKQKLAVSAQGRPPPSSSASSLNPLTILTSSLASCRMGTSHAVPTL